MLTTLASHAHSIRSAAGVALGLALLQGCSALGNPASAELSEARVTHALAEERGPTVVPDSGPATSDLAREAALGPRSFGAAEEGEPASPWHRFSLTAGGLLSAVDSSVRVGPSGAGIEVDVEQALGFQTGVTSARVSGAWRFTRNKKHRFDLSWIDLTRKSDKTLKTDLDLGNGLILPAGSGVSSEFGLQLIKTEYSYSFVQDERLDMAATFGFYVAPIDFKFQASGLSTASDSFDVTAPLPLGGLRMDLLISPKFYLRSSMSVFYVEVGDYKGSMQDLIVACEWVPTKHLGVGLGVDSFRLGVDQDGSTSIPGVSSRGSIGLEYTGLMLYVRGLF